MKKGILLLLFICNLMTVSTFAQIRYVKVGGTGNGSSWANASGSIQDMIDYTFSGGEVWVGEGTYNLSATLQMKEGVDVYGGFFGDETSITDRPKSDLDNNGTIEPWEYTHASVLNGQNTVQVVNQATDFSVETTWDGVTITNGKNTTGEGGGASIKANCILTNAVISNNSVNGTNTRGGGVYNSGGTIRNCIISNNTSSAIGNGGNSDIYSYGGGVYNLGGAVSNCVISNNTASSVGVFSNINYTYGGGIYNSGIISNCTISNNTVYLTGPSSQSKLYGGGICNANTSVLVRNCIVSNNTPAGYLSFITYGGGIYQGTIDSCTVTNNSATQGGGIYGSENISNCIVNGNTSKSYGGGIYSSGNNVTIANCIVSENVASSSTASPYGGGIYCSGSNSTIANCTINGNTVSNPTASASYSAYGGGVAFANITAKIMDCIIKDNRTLKNELQGGYGGGIYQGIITRCRIEDNTSGEGGGFYGSSAYNCLLLNNVATTNGGGGFVATNGKSVNCTFVGNRSGRGGGIYFNTNTGTSAANCIFWHNYALVWEQVGTPSGSNAADVTYSAIQEQYPGTGNIIIAEDNENGGPLFFNNYNLQVNSPCINTGSNAILTLSDTIDLAGNIRIYDTIVDMGAYERQGIDPPTYIISGQVTYNGNPLAGVMMIHEGDSSLLTNASGEYSITVYQGANITLTPTKEGYGFFPPSVTFSNISNNIVQDFTSVMVISVTNITNIPDTIFSRVPYTLSGVVVPNNATNQTIIWSVVSAGTTGATITGNTLNTTAEGTVTVMATIIDGITMGVNYVQNFSIVSSLNYYCNGNGTSSNPYQICTPRQLRAFAICINTGEGNTTSGKYYKLMNDIDLSIYDYWDPIGNNSVYNNTHRFQGNFDGNEKVVRNLTINNSSDYQGLFGYTINGTIQNLGIENCNVNGEEYVGGLLGYSNNTTISNCYSSGNVSGSSTCVGGLVGLATLSISNCYSTANVVGNENVGGLVGYNESNISNSYASGKVKAGGDYVGGLVGRQNYGNIKNCVAANDSIITTSNVSNISRVCGNNSGLYYNNYALDIMIIKEGNNSYYLTSSSNTAGTSKSPVTLKSLSFYATTSNWYSTATSWSIVDTSGIWQICDGDGLPFLRWQGLTCGGFVPVTNITGVSTTTTANAPLTLTGTVLPSNATYQTITWSVQNAGTTGATIAGNTLNTTAVGTVTVRATITNGTAIGINYTHDFTITVSNSVLGGVVSIAGSAVFGETLTAVTSGLTSTPTVSLGTLSYQWKRSNTNIGTNSATYVLVEEDINQTITVTVSAGNCAGNVISAATAAVAKASQSAPSLPTLSSTTTTSIMLNEVSGCEYNINSGIWQSSAIFQGLTANTSYTFTQRKKETATHFASLPSEPAAFSTDVPLYSVVSSVNNTAFGTVTPYGETQVEEGSDLMFNITPYSNYVIDSVIVNGEFQGTMDTYTFTNIQSNCSLLAVFKREVGIVETELSGISVCPNPTRDELRITSNKGQIGRIEFFDVIGKKVFTPLPFQNSSEIVVNISHLQVGIYFVRISTEAGDVIKKVLKE